MGAAHGCAREHVMKVDWGRVAFILSLGVALVYLVIKLGQSSLSFFIP